MPRGSASGKRQQGQAASHPHHPNHRDSRHDNGPVAPGRRVARNKGHGQLDGGARNAEPLGPSAPSAAVPPLSASPTSNGHANGASNGSAKYHGVGVLDDAVHGSLRRQSIGGCSETSSADSMSPIGNGTAEAVHRHIDVNASKNANVHRDSGPFELAATVLRALPLYDTLAILIILMQVPPIALSSIYLLFSCLTYVPPVQTSSGLNINLAEIFDWTSTMPSLVTVFCLDFLTLLIWLFLWPSMQHAVLDLAKPVIAATLGGGATSREGTSRSVSACFLFTISTHVLRSSHFRRFLPPQWRTSLAHSPLSMASAGQPDLKAPYGWLTTILGIHILMQGIVRYIRDWYIRRERSGSTASHAVTDPEAGKSPFPPDLPVDPGASAATDTDSSLHPNANVPSTKKRRKQSAQVRLQQPLWAALASTKIVMVKEYELSHAAAESAGSNATDIHNLGNAPFDSEAEKVWISYIGYDDVCFDTSYFPDHECDADSRNEPARPLGVDLSKPFYVRINNAHWPSTRIHPVPDLCEPPEDAPAGTRWTGDIYGLRPMAKYVCEFVHSRTHEVIFSTSITTTQEPSKDADSTGPAPPNSQRRPDSPATTLKTSIAAADAKLVDERSRLKTLRKEWKARINALKKENEGMDHSIQSAGGTDDRIRQKIRQQETQKAQSEKDAEDLDKRLRSSDACPPGFVERKKQTERDWEREKLAYDTAQKEFKSYRGAINSAVKAKESDQHQLRTKRTKIATRIAKVDTELANIADANMKGLNEAERRKQERERLQSQMSPREFKRKEHIGDLKSTNSNKQDQINTAIQQFGVLQEQVNYANGSAYDLADRQPVSSQPFATGAWHPNPAAMPHIPASLWQSTADPAMPAVSSAMVPTSIFSMSSAAQQVSAPQGKHRGRSSSLLSDVSGLTQSSNADDEAGPPAASRPGQRGPGGLLKARKRSEGSGRSSLRSGSGSGSGSSLKDPTSPT